MRRVLAALVVAVVVALVLFVVVTQRERVFASEDRRVDHSTYQAVFLTSSQVYFGKLTIDGNDYLLSDVFYLNAPAQGSSSGQLVKRGNELHGPTEPMIIPASSVLFIENMRTDSEVIAAIRAFKAGVTPAPAATTVPTTPPTTAPTQPAATPSRSPSPSASR
jgi:hypothetical protein